MSDDRKQTFKVRPSVRRCSECRQKDQPRGSWSPYFCEPCDITRMHRISNSLASITGDDSGAHDMDWYVAKSAEISERAGWTHA